MSGRAAIDAGALVTAGLTAMLWGLTGVFVRLLPSFPPVGLTALRLAIAFAVLSPLLAFSAGARRNLAASATRASSYLLASLLVGYYLLATAAFQLAPVAEVAVLLSTPPVFVLLWRRLRGATPERRQVLGALLAVAGIALILAPGWMNVAAVSPARLAGDLLAFGAAALTSVYAVYASALARRGRAPDSIALSALTLALGSVVAAAGAVLIESGVAIGFDGRTASLLIGLGVLCTAVPTLGIAVASRRLPAVVTACISLSIPIFAALFAHGLLGESLSATFLPGLVLAIAGMAAIVVPARRVPGAAASR